MATAGDCGKHLQQHHALIGVVIALNTEPNLNEILNITVWHSLCNGVYKICIPSDIRTPPPKQHRQPRSVCSSGVKLNIALIHFQLKMIRKMQFYVH